MKLFLIYQDKNNNYDAYDSAVVCAENMEEAIKIHPDGEYDYKEEPIESWVKKEYVQVKYIGEAGNNIKKGVVCASFNAG